MCWCVVVVPVYPVVYLDVLFTLFGLRFCIGYFVCRIVIDSFFTCFLFI